MFTREGLSTRLLNLKDAVTIKKDKVIKRVADGVIAAEKSIAQLPEQVSTRLGELKTKIGEVLVGAKDGFVERYINEVIVQKEQPDVAIKPNTFLQPGSPSQMVVEFRQKGLDLNPPVPKKEVVKTFRARKLLADLYGVFITEHQTVGQPSVRLLGTDHTIFTGEVYGHDPSGVKAGDAQPFDRSTVTREMKLRYVLLPNVRTFAAITLLWIGASVAQDILSQPPKEPTPVVIDQPEVVVQECEDLSKFISYQQANIPKFPVGFKGGYLQGKHCEPFLFNNWTGTDTSQQLLIDPNIPGCNSETVLATCVADQSTP